MPEADQLWDYWKDSGEGALKGIFVVCEDGFDLGFSYDKSLLEVCQESVRETD